MICLTSNTLKEVAAYLKGLGCPRRRHRWELPWVTHHRCLEWLPLRTLWPAALLLLHRGRPHLQTHQEWHLMTTTPPSLAL